MGRDIGRFSGTPPESDDEPGVLCGNAGSPGTVRGPEKVIRTLYESDKLAGKGRRRCRQGRVVSSTRRWNA